jgi:hypothetical protein
MYDIRIKVLITHVLEVRKKHKTFVVNIALLIVLLIEENETMAAH